MKTLTGFVYYPDSLEEAEGITYFLVRSEDENLKYLGVLGNPAGFSEGQGIAGDSGATTHLFPLTAENAAVLRQRLPWLRPQPLGLQLSVGFGDHLGLATPGHVQAVEGTDIAPIFAQQSVRQITRTHRTPQQVLDDAMWGVLQTGWRKPWGADADRLKMAEDIDSFYDAGFTFFTIDPGEYIDSTVQTDSLDTLWDKVRALPWDRLHSSFEESVQRYANQVISFENYHLSLNKASVLRALAKYGQAIVHLLSMTQHLNQRAAGQDYDLEVAVQETGQPTTPEEHYLLASELRRLGVHWTSLAPRFNRRFGKDVDIAGDLAGFEKEFAVHAAIARHFGNYRLSLHLDSDIYSIYQIIAGQAHGLVHLKTSGTSYLEALRVIAQVDPDLFRKILQSGIENYPIDRASYAGQASPPQVVLDPFSLADSDLPDQLNQLEVRQILHVTYGAVLEHFGPELLTALRANEDLFYETLAEHFKKYLDPFIHKT